MTWRRAAIDPLRHFIDAGLHERRDPNRWFDGAWYVRQYADVAASGAHPLLHYMSEGAKQRRDPHPRFDAGMVFRATSGGRRQPVVVSPADRRATRLADRAPVAIEALAAVAAGRRSPRLAVAVDVVVPVYRGLEVTRRCLESVLADTERPAAEIIVIDDRSPEPKLRTGSTGWRQPARSRCYATSAIWGSSPRSIAACGMPATTMSRC